MNIEALHQLIREARWFSNLGRFDAPEGMVALRDLGPWAGVGAQESPEVRNVADNMDWLPSSRDQEDPLSGGELDAIASALGVQSAAKEASAEVYKLTLLSLRGAVSDSLKVGPHDFTEAAKGSALFAARRAVTEIIAKSPGVWCRLLSVYAAGNWPCGILPNGMIVVL